MTVNRFSSAVLGFLTALPLVSVVTYTTYLLPRLTTAGSHEGITKETYFDLFNLTFAILGATMLLSAALLAFYALFVHRGRRVPAAKRSLWTAILLVGNIIAMPVFWYLYVWPRDTERSQECGGHTLEGNR